MVLLRLFLRWGVSLAFCCTNMHQHRAFHIFNLLHNFLHLGNIMAIQWPVITKPVLQRGYPEEEAFNEPFTL